MKLNLRSQPSKTIIKETFKLTFNKIDNFYQNIIILNNFI